MAEHLLEEQRENWGTRAGFVLAAIGSAVGLGNLWGFPYKVYSHGGGAFLVPYLFAMLVIGIPVLILELSLGHMSQRASPLAFRSVSRKAEAVGWWGIILAFVIITYYAVVLAWALGYLVISVKAIFTAGGELPWSGAEPGTAGAAFYNDFLRMWPEDSGVASWTLGSLVTPLVAALAVVWLMMYLCIFRGVRIVSKVVLYTVPLPWIMLLILTIRGLTLPGAEEGLAYYLEPEWGKLADPETWRWGFGQMFFSMSLAFGVMITYASFLHRKSDINNNATIIGLADVATSFVAGLTVFATLGAMTFATRAGGEAVAVETVVEEGPGLAFVAFPYALAQLPQSAWFAAVFFLALLTLGIDSAFSITESALASLVDKTGWNRGKVLIGMTLVGFAIGLVYCTRGGLAWLGGMDDFINSTWGGIALLGLLQCAVLGWGYRLGRLREHANERSDWRLGAWWDWVIRYFAPVALSVLFSWSLLKTASGEGGFLYNEQDVLQVPRLAGLILAFCAPLLAVVLTLIPSGPAGTHAAHKHQPRMGRAGGVIGSLLAVFAVVGVAVGFQRTLATGVALRIGEQTHESIWAGDWLQSSAGLTVTLLAAAAAVALVALIVGSAGVTWGEKHEHRPSRLSRLAGGLGTLMFGAAGGVGLQLVLAWREAAAGAAQGQAVEEAAEPAVRELTGVSYVVLAVMVTLLVFGLGWCFYRAVKAAGGTTPEEQYPEDA
ncbi:MAG: sodium-dependent transporter [Phycisphaerae bacterium]